MPDQQYRQHRYDDVVAVGHLAHNTLMNSASLHLLCGGSRIGGTIWCAIMHDEATQSGTEWLVLCTRLSCLGSH